MRRTSARVTTALLLGAGLSLVCQAPAAQAAATRCPVVAPQLVNGGFEQPVVNPGFPRKVPQADVPGWLFSEQTMEIWPPGVTETPPGGTIPYTAAEGVQFLELNGNRPDGVAQTFVTEPGSTLLYELYHRGRTVTDTAELHFGRPGVPAPGILTMTDGPDAWGRYDGAFDVPAGQTATAIRFISVTGSGPDGSIGNFLDGIRVAAAGCVDLTKSVADLTRSGTPQVGDVLEVRVVVRNAGGAPTRATAVLDDVPAGTTYEPGSLRILSGPDAGPQTDAADADHGLVTATGQVRFDIADAAEDELGPDGVVTVSFRIRVGADAAAETIANTATASYRLVDLAGALLEGTETAASNTVTLGPVPAPATPTPSTPPGTGSTGQAASGAAAELPATGPSALIVDELVLGLLLCAAGALLVSRARSR